MSVWSVKDAVTQFHDDEFTDGDLLSHDWIMHALEVTEADLIRDRFKLLDRMDQFRSVMLHEYQIALQNVRGKGYRVVPPAQQAEFAARTAAEYIQRGVKKSSDLLEHTRTDQLTDSERQRHIDTEVRMSSLKGMIGKGKRDVFALFSSE